MPAAVRAAVSRRKYVHAKRGSGRLDITLDPSRRSRPRNTSRGVASCPPRSRSRARRFTAWLVPVACSTALSINSNRMEVPSRATVTRHLHLRTFANQQTGLFFFEWHMTFSTKCHIFPQHDCGGVVTDFKRLSRRSGEELSRAS